MTNENGKVNGWSNWETWNWMNWHGDTLRAWAEDAVKEGGNEITIRAYIDEILDELTDEIEGDGFWQDAAKMGINEVNTTEIAEAVYTEFAVTK